MQLQPGTRVLNGRFRIERLLGAGGSGEVYLATRTSRLSGQVALKILRRGESGVDTAKIESYRERFELEGRLQDELGTSPGIVRVIDDGDYDGSPVLVMDYMSGGTLKQEIVAAARNGLPWQRCAEVLRQAAIGLQALHARGYVHRDVKPSNILLDAQRNAKIADLGVVQTELTRTRTDGLSFDHPCSPGYCSPEHAVGTAALSPAADVYALGVIGFEMLSGHLPQPSALDQPIEPIDRDAPDWFKALITRMLAYDYRERPKTSEAVALAIRDGLQDEREGAARRVARMAELGRKIEEVLAKQPHARAELDEADSLLDELRNLAPADFSTMDFTIRLARALRVTPVVPPQLPPEPIKPLTRQQRLRQLAELRLDLDPAQRERRWDDVVRLAEALLDLAPDDRDAMSALNEAIFEQEKRKREITAARETLRKRVADRAWDQIEAAAQALLALAPDDPEALQARAELADELERRRVAAARQKTEGEARATLRKVMGKRAWDSVADAAAAVLAFVPGDGEALKAQADLRAERERVAAHARAVTEARGALRTALAARDWRNVADWAVELLALAPDDAEALQAQAEHQAELERRRIAAEKKQAEDAAREALRRVVRAQNWDQVERCASALLFLLPHDAEALQARAALAAELERRRVAAARQKAEDEARAALRKVMGERASESVADAAAAVLALAPGDGEAVKAEADAQAHLDFKPGLRRVSADRLVLAIALGVEMEFVRVPAGPFLMGSNKPPSGAMQRIKRALSSESPNTIEDPLAVDNELPQHPVSLPEYWIGKAPVTVAQFAVYVKASGAKTSASSDVYTKANHPVVGVTWDDCIAFCGWASKLGGGEVLLPSEAEWEKAARGSDGRIYPWGNEAPDSTRLNFHDSSIYTTTPVGQHGAKWQSPYGCDDMAGNVREWTRSIFKNYPYTAHDGREDVASEDARVLRGGLFLLAQFARCAFRLGGSPNLQFVDCGFRVILRLPSLDKAGTGPPNL